MRDGISGRIRLACLAFCLVTAVFGTARAQAPIPDFSGSDEPIGSQGAPRPQLALTQAQKGAIYNAVSQQRARGSTTKIPLDVGAPVPPSIVLSDLPLQFLPDEVSAESPDVALLKYAMVENHVVIVDPIRMRVVDVIHRGITSGAVP